MADKITYNDYPFYEVAAQVQDLIREGHTIFQKFSCAKCGVRQGMDVPNVLYKTGRCQECGHVTDIEKQGCNYLLHVQGPAAVDELLRRFSKR